MKCMRERKDLFRDRAWMAVAREMVAERQRGGLVEAGGE